MSSKRAFTLEQHRTLAFHRSSAVALLLTLREASGGCTSIPAHCLSLGDQKANRRRYGSCVVFFQQRDRPQSTSCLTLHHATPPPTLLPLKHCARLSRADSGVQRWVSKDHGVPGGLNRRRLQAYYRGRFFTPLAKRDGTIFCVFRSAVKR